MSMIRRPGFERMPGRLDTGGLGRPQSPDRTNLANGGGRQSPLTPPDSPLKRRNAIKVIGAMAGRNAAVAALRLLGGAKGPQMPQATPWQPPNQAGFPAMPMPQPWANQPDPWPPLPPRPPKPPALQPKPPLQAQRPAVPPKPPGWHPTPLQMPQGPSLPNPWERLANVNANHRPAVPQRPPETPLPNPYDRPAAQWQQPAPQGFPQRPGAAPGQNVDAYPIQVKPTQGQQKLFRKEQQQATQVPTLAKNIGRLYHQLNLKVTGDTLPAFTNAHVLEKPKQLGSGAFNTVFSVKLKNPDGTPFDGVFKPLGSVEKGWVAAATGIPKDDPQIAMRNIATVTYAKKLGLDVVPNTRMAVIDTGRGVVDPDLGLIMERARGKPAFETDAKTLGRADVCAEITKLQLLDHLTGQGDRHANNYFINIENGRAKVMGIDNDQCFGKNLKDPAGIQQMDNDRLRWGFRGTGLPPVVDTEMARSINSLTSRDIRAMLGNKLSEPEIEAAIARHEGVKDHIAKLRSEGRVIDPSQWNERRIQRLMTPENSYFGRERNNALAQQAAAPRDNRPAANHNF